MLYHHLESIHKTAEFMECYESCHKCDVAILSVFFILCYLGINRKGRFKKERTQKMKKNGTKILFYGFMLIVAFIIWTASIQIVNVRPIGPNGSRVGFASFNRWFHQLTGVHMTLYTVTDWLGLLPVFVCTIFGGIGFFQLIKRKSLRNVDYDLLLLGIYYITVIVGYLIFEIVPINFRPVLIEGRLEASYPSSTTLLVLCVMPTLVEQTNRRSKKAAVKRIIKNLAACFSIAMVIGRLLSGVHWFTDIMGAVILSIGLFFCYKAAVLLCNRKKR